MQKTIYDYAHGALIGTIAGEAIQSNVNDFRTQLGMIRTSHNPLFADPVLYRFASDLQLTTVESIIDQRSFDPVDQMKRMLAWYDKTNKQQLPESLSVALTNAKDHGIVFAGSQECALSDGSHLIRVIPIAIAYRRASFRKLMTISMLNASLTHALDICLDATKYVALFIRDSLNREPHQCLTDVLIPSPHVMAYISEAWQADVVNLVAGSYTRLKPSQLYNKNSMLCCLQRSLWCLYHSHSFENAFEHLMSTTDIPDHTYSLLGAMAGAWYGYSSIPLQLEKYCHDYPLTYGELAESLLTLD